MSTDRLHDEVQELLGVYALDALEPGETEAIERHLASCTECQREVDQHREMAAALGNSVEPLPSDLWDRIADGLGHARETEGRRRPERFTQPNPSTSHRSKVPPEATRHQQPGGNPRRSRTRGLWDSRWTLPVVVAASLVVIALLSAGLVRANDKLGQARQALDGRASEAVVQAAQATPGHRTVSLRSVSGSQVAQMAVLPNGRGYLVSSSLPALLPGRTYQLWAMFGSRAVSLGLLGRDPGSAAFTLASGHPTQLAVTVEPSGGVAVPDRLPVASGAITA